MITMTSESRIVKATNLLVPTAEELVDMKEAFAPTEAARCTPIDQRTLPRIDGSGLTEEEFHRVNGFGNRARVAYAASMPDADDRELARVERRARQDGLRAVLRDRPAAPPLSCCSPTEAAPCAGCVQPMDTVEPVTDEASTDTRRRADRWLEAYEIDAEIERLRFKRDQLFPSFRITNDCGDVGFEAAPGLTLEKVIADDVARLTAHPALFVSERVIWQDGDVMAVIGQREDGSPFVVRLDEYPEEAGVGDSDAIPSGADPHMTAEELADLAELNRTNPEGAVKADLGRFPAFDIWPESTSDWHWTPEPGKVADARLNLAELIELEAARLQARGNDAGSLMARSLAELARTVRTVNALVPADVEARTEVLGRDLDSLAAAWEVPGAEFTPAGRLA